MSLPDDLRSDVEARIGAFRLLGQVGGGCIHPAFRIDTPGGELFLKYGRGTGAGFFAAEAAGLKQLAAGTTHLRVPAVHGYADTGDGRPFGWIALEWLEPGHRGRDFGARLGEGLAELHAAVASGWGWERDGFIGSLPQANEPVADWPSFWRDRRLQPQLARARACGRLPATQKAWQQLLERLPELLDAGEYDGPSLLHGDLWGGNILATAGGEPAIVDPAVYRGHAEVDLAMSELFGGFDPSFYQAYAERRPLRPGYREQRCGVYQLYYLLVHVNLFGEGYVAHTAATLRSVLASR